MATNFPTNLDALTNPTPNDRVDVVSHSDQHANVNDAIEALQTKVGINDSAVTTTHDYKLSEVTGADKTVGKTATQTLTNKTLTSPTINTPDITSPTFTGTAVSLAAPNLADPNITGVVEIDLGSDATGDTYYRDASGNFVRLPIGTDGHVLTVAGGLPTYAAPTSGASTLLLAYLAANQTTSSTSPVKINFDTEEYDTSSAFASGTFTAPSAGYYRVTAHCTLSVTSSTGREMNGMIYKNGSVYARGAVTTADVSGGKSTIVISRIVNLASSDTVDFYIQQASAESITVFGGQTYSFLSIEKL